MKWRTEPLARSGGSLKGLKGHLIVIKVHDIHEDVRTQRGVSDQALVTFFDIETTTYARRVTWSAKVVVRDLSDYVGAIRIARVGQLPAQPGKHPAWILEDVSTEEIAYAREILDRYSVLLS